MERAQSSPRRAGTEQSGISSDDDPVAQSAEQLPFKQWVRGSNPRRVTRKRGQKRFLVKKLRDFKTSEALG